MNEQTRLLALAHLKNEKKPADVAEILGISYSAALKLKKELHAAEERNRVLELFDLSKASLEILLDSVKKQLEPAIEAFGIQEVVEGEVKSLTESISGGQLLDQEFQNAAKTLALRITQVTITANNADTILSLAKALCELQNAFFGKDNTPTNGVPGVPMSSFEQHLKP